MATQRRKAERLKAYVGHFSWSQDDEGAAPHDCKSTRLTCFAVALAVDDAVERFYELLGEHSKGKHIAPKAEIFLDDMSEIAIDAPMATLLLSAMDFGSKIHGSVFGTLGTAAVKHYEGRMKENKSDAGGRPSSYTPQPFAVVAADGSFFRPS